MNISIIGTGYVGLVTGTCLADFGLSVTCVDQDETKISLLNSSGVPIYEPNLAPLIKKNVSAGRLTFTTDLEKAVKESKVIFIAVGTPSNNDGSVNLVQIEEVAKQIALSINNYKVIVIKSTVPVGITRKIEEIINKNQPDFVIPAKAGIHSSGHCEGVKRPKQSQSLSKSLDFDVASNPEFLREGSAVYDFTHPDKIEYFDPLAMENSRKVLPTLTYCQDEYETAEHCDALVIATEWNQFRNLDLLKIKKLLKSPILLGLRNLYDPAVLKSLGLIYEGVGRR
jgi:UDP-glucose 6-dehydrogenase